MSTKSPSITPHHSTTSILKQSHFNTSDWDDDVYQPPDSVASSTLPSPSLSLSSSSTLHYKASTMTDHRTSSSTNSRHFYSSGLGRPPGSQKRKTTPTPTPSSSFPMTSSPNKTIPMKELQKIITDLKKENFDLKLRLYHLEQQTEKDLDKCWLEDENHRLQLELDDRTAQLEKLEDTVTTLLSKATCDASTQTTLPPALDTESRSHVVQSKSSPFSAPVLPTFPADPASFGLPPSSTQSASSRHNNVDVAAMVHRFQNVHLASPKVNRRHSSAAPPSCPKPFGDDHGRVTGWLDRIPMPSFMSPSPSSPYTHPTQSH